MRTRSGIKRPDACKKNLHTTHFCFGTFSKPIKYPVLATGHDHVELLHSQHHAARKEVHFQYSGVIFPTSTCSYPSAQELRFQTLKGMDVLAPTTIKLGFGAVKRDSYMLIHKPGHERP